jgi:Amt family ammonium transporter
MEPKLDTGDTAWLLVSCALVLLMTPALALFYGGMVRRKNVLSTIMHSMVAIPIMSILWALAGYTLAFGPSKGGFIGGMDFFALKGTVGQLSGTVPTLAFVAFQMMFAVITPALISGAFAERMKFTAYCAFIVLWSLLVYVPVAHWVWNPGGWLFKMNALDFAGGTVVHATAGASALVCALVIGARDGYPSKKALPHNLTMTMTGAGILWFGWFGFNAGSALTSGQLASVAFMATHLGAAGGAVGWVAAESAHRGKATALGCASGLVAGLVAITPAAGFVTPGSSIVIGLLAGAVCYGGVLIKEKFHYDDSLDAFGVHGIGGIFGALITGVFATKAVNEAGQDGLLYGNPGQLKIQFIAVSVSVVYAVVLTYVILKIIDATLGLRVDRNDEIEGLDSVLHGEDGYAMNSTAHSESHGGMRRDDEDHVALPVRSPAFAK